MRILFLANLIIFTVSVSTQNTKIICVLPYSNALKSCRTVSKKKCGVMAQKSLLEKKYLTNTFKTVLICRKCFITV